MIIIHMMIAIFVLFVFSASSQCIIHPLGSPPHSPEEPSCPAYSPNHATTLVIHVILIIIIRIEASCPAYSPNYATTLVILVIIIVIMIVVSCPIPLTRHPCHGNRHPNHHHRHHRNHHHQDCSELSRLLA